MKIYGAKNAREARSAAKRWSNAWEDMYPSAVKCLRDDLDDLLTFFGFPDTSFRKKVRTTNTIERIFREVRRRIRPMGSSRTRPAWKESYMLSFSMRIYAMECTMFLGADTKYLTLPVFRVPFESKGCFV